MQRLRAIPHDYHPALLQVRHHGQSEASCLIQTLAPWPGLMVLPNCVGNGFCKPLVVDWIHAPTLTLEHDANNAAGGRA